LKLKLAARRWHVFQPNISDKGFTFMDKKTVNPSDFLSIQVNVPDSCLPEILTMSNLPNLLLSEEHFLIRSIPYLNPKDKSFGSAGYNNLLFQKIFSILKSKLINTSTSFNEERLYDLI